MYNKSLFPQAFQERMQFINKCTRKGLVFPEAEPPSTVGEAGMRSLNILDLYAQSIVSVEVYYFKSVG